MFNAVSCGPEDTKDQRQSYVACGTREDLLSDIKMSVSGAVFIGI